MFFACAALKELKSVTRVLVSCREVKEAIWEMNAVSSMGFKGSCDDNCFVNSCRKSLIPRLVLEELELDDEELEVLEVLLLTEETVLMVIRRMR